MLRVGGVRVNARAKPPVRVASHVVRSNSERRSRRRPVRPVLAPVLHTRRAGGARRRGSGHRRDLRRRRAGPRARVSPRQRCADDPGAARVDRLRAPVRAAAPRLLACRLQRRQLGPAGLRPERRPSPRTDDPRDDRRVAPDDRLGVRAVRRQGGLRRRPRGGRRHRLLRRGEQPEGARDLVPSPARVRQPRQRRLGEPALDAPRAGLGDRGAREDRAVHRVRRREGGALGRDLQLRGGPGGVRDLQAGPARDQALQHPPRARPVPPQAPAGQLRRLPDAGPADHLRPEHALAAAHQRGDARAPRLREGARRPRGPRPVVGRARVQRPVRRSRDALVRAGGARSPRRDGRGDCMTDPFARWGAFMHRRRWWVLGAWLIVLIACGPFAGKANSVLKAGGIEAPSSDSSVAATTLSQKFSVSALNNAAIVFHSDTLKVGSDQFKSEVKAAAARVRKAKGVTKVVTYYKTLLPTLVSKDRHTTVVFASMKGNEAETQTYIAGVREAIGDVPLQHYVTGQAAINHDFQDTSEKDVKRSEVITFSLVLILLLLTFGTVVSAFLPLVLGAAAVATASAGLYAIGSATNTSTFALNVASMIGLGLAIDFSLIVVSRFREELAVRRDTESALVATMATAGRSIVYSGVTVMLGMLALTVLVNLMVVRSISLGVMLVAITALIAGMTLLPATLAVLGPRVERLRVLPKRTPKAETEGFWYRWSHMIMRRPWLWLGVSVAIIVVLALPVLGLKMLGATSKLLPQHVESVKGLDYIDKQFGKNDLVPIQIVLKTPKGKVFTPKVLTGLDTLSNTLAADRRSTGVTSLATYMAAEPRYDGRYKHLRPGWD